jgi:NodT family efflux transporter outer membrane factor (OMF) lipoprotein
MRAPPLAFGSLALLLAGGCTVGPWYRKPPSPTGAEAPLVSVTPTVESRAAPPDAWWRLYRDPRLDRLIDEAFAANDDLKAAEANLAAARAVLLAARAGRYPTTDVTSSAIRGRDAITDEILALTGRNPRTIWIYRDELDANWELDLFGRVRRSIRAARADAEATQAARDAVKITVAAETARAYARICALGEQLAVARRSVELSDRQADIVARRAEAGAGTHFDLVRAQGVVAQSESAPPPLEGQQRAALFELTALLGRTPAQAPAEVEACAAPPQLAAAIPVGDGAALLRRRPDVRQAERRLAAATERIGVATADLYPKVVFRSFYGAVAPTREALTTRFGLTWGVGPVITWSFPNQAAQRARVRQARAGAQAALASFDSTVLTALKETEQALVAYNAELIRGRSLETVRARAREAYELARGQYLAGAISTLDLLNAEQTLISAEAAVAASDATLVDDQIAVFKALGGGWEPGVTTPGADISRP